MTKGSSDYAAQADRGASSSWAIASMTCAGCAAGLEASLAAHPGMLVCEVRFKEGHMQCIIDEQQLEEATIPLLVDRLGFKARQIEQPVDLKTSPTARPKPRGDDHV